MGSPYIINSAADLKALEGTPTHAQAMAALRGTLHRLVRDEEAEQWRVEEDDRVIARLGLQRSDFGAVPPPPLPEWEDAPEPQPAPVPMHVARRALLDAGLLDEVEQAIDAIADPLERERARIDWQFAPSLSADSPAMQLLQAGGRATREDIVLTLRGDVREVTPVTPAEPVEPVGPVVGGRPGAIGLP